MISGLFRFSTIRRSLHNTSYAKLNCHIKILAVSMFVATIMLFGAAGAALAQSPIGGPLAPIATDPARDAALKSFLQKHFKIPSP
ncbi:MAG: hypothetical protein ABSD30_15645, partial [Candidatus Binatus sp.]